MIELILFRSGMDTLQIARLQGTDESIVYNCIHEQREMERKQEARRRYAPNSRDYQANYYLQVTKPKRAGRKEWDR